MRSVRSSRSIMILYEINIFIAILYDIPHYLKLMFPRPKTSFIMKFINERAQIYKILIIDGVFFKFL